MNFAIFNMGITLIAMSGYALAQFQFCKDWRWAGICIAEAIIGDFIIIFYCRTF